MNGGTGSPDYGDPDGSRNDCQALLRAAIADAGSFLRLTASKRRGGTGSPWQKISVRPVLIRGERQFQFTYSDGKKEICRNFATDEAGPPLDELLADSFMQFHVQAATGDLHIRMTRKGRALISRGKPSHPDAGPDLAHDHAKQYLLRAEEAGPLLRGLGIANADGSIRPSMGDKFRQINEFLKIVEGAVAEILPGNAPLRIVDCGCGSAYLTFAAYHYFRHRCGRPVHVTGVDLNEELIRKCGRLRDSLQYTELQFCRSSIIDFAPDEPPGMVLSLHACDTATDEALAQGVRWESSIILAAPCCQHELHRSLRLPVFQPVLRHGILRERFADILTDTLRALVLQILGYHTDVIQFISPEHTSKNLMIRAVKRGQPNRAALLKEYQDLKNLWNVTPAIERLLEDKLEAVGI